jgi:hypothetical protein
MLLDQRPNQRALPSQRILLGGGSGGSFHLLADYFRTSGQRFQRKNHRERNFLRLFTADF